jgi:hypothetical protein
VTELRAGQPRNCGSVPSRGKKFFSVSQCPVWLWVPSCFLLIGYWGLLQDKSSQGVKLATDLGLFLRSAFSEIITPLFLMP